MFATNNFQKTWYKNKIFSETDLFISLKDSFYFKCSNNVFHTVVQYVFDLKQETQKCNYCLRNILIN